MKEKDKEIIKNFLESAKELEKTSEDVDDWEIAQYLLELQENYSDLELAIDVLENHKTLCKALKDEN